MAAVHAEFTVDDKDIAAGRGGRKLAGRPVVDLTAKDLTAVHGNGAVQVDVTGAVTGGTVFDGAAVDGEDRLAGNEEVTAVTALAGDLTAGHSAVIHDKLSGAVQRNVAAVVAGLTVLNGAAVHLKQRAGGHKDVAADAPLVGGGLLIGIILGDDGLSKAVTDDAVVQHELGLAAQRH